LKVGVDGIIKVLIFLFLNESEKHADQLIECREKLSCKKMMMIIIIIIKTIHTISN